MAKEVIMPALGMAQETGVLVTWFKAEGDQVAKGEVLMEVETDKATVEVEAAASGTLISVTARPGDSIPVGQVIALILAPGESAPATAPNSTQTHLSPAGSLPAPAGPVEDRPRRVSPVAARIAADHQLDLAQVKPAGPRIQKDDVLAHLPVQASDSTTPADGRTLASPKARRLARERGLDLAGITGSGPEGAVLAADVLEAAGRASLPEAGPAPVLEPVPMSRMWQVMAQRLTESWQTIPHFFLEAEANATRLRLWQAQAQQRLAEKLTMTDLLLKLVATALRHHPRLNAKWVRGAIVANPEINLGLAVAVEEGLLVPVIQQADRLGLKEIAARRQALVARAQANKLSPADISDGTFTLSNLGMYGVDSFKAIVNPPQAAILALGRIADKVVPLNGQASIQPMLKLSLSCDHRIVDGARGAQFLQTLVGFIEEPLAILD